VIELDGAYGAIVHRTHPLHNPYSGITALANNVDSRFNRQTDVVQEEVRYNPAWISISS
jgi:hypothetical protein